ncbi:MAG: elongation factor 4, partial [Trueperaceae bacterium]
DIVQARLEREFDLSLIATAPGVVYDLVMTDGKRLRVQNPSELPAPDRIETISEPWVALSVFLPEEYVGSAMGLVQEKR